MRTLTLNLLQACRRRATSLMSRRVPRGRCRGHRHADPRLRQFRAGTVQGQSALRGVARGAGTVWVSVLVAGLQLPAALPAAPPQLSLSGSVPRKAATPAEAKLDSRLLAAVDRLRIRAAPFSSRDALEVDGEQRVLVDMRAEVTPESLDAIEAGGGVVVSQFPRYEAIRARVPVEALIPLAERDDVKGIRPADRAITR